MRRNTDEQTDEQARKGFAVLAAWLVVVSMLAPAFAAPAAAQGGMVGVPDNAISDSVPDYAAGQIPDAKAFEGDTMTTAGASTLSVAVTTKSAVEGRAHMCSTLGTTPDFCDDPEIAFNFSDFENSEGRQVAVKAAPVIDSLGYVPEFAYVEHSSGETYQTSVERRGDMLVWELRHFSSNTVTFSGEYNLTANPAMDGDQFTYDSPDGGENLVINVTGVTNSESDNAFASAVSNGGTVAVNVADTGLSPTGPSANGEPVVKFTGIKPPEHNPLLDEGDGTIDNNLPFLGDDGSNNPIKSSYEFTPSSNITLSSLNVNLDTGVPYDPVADIRIAQGGADTTWGEGTLVKTGYDGSGGNVSLDSTYKLQKGTTYEIEFITTNSDGDGFGDVGQLETDKSPSTVKAAYNYSSEYTKNQFGDLDLIGARTTDPSVDIDGDGTAEASVNGTLSGGETVQKEISSLSTSDDSTTVNLTRGEVDVSILLKERTPTKDVVVELNGHTTSYSGTLADGSTVSLSTNDSWIVNGTNQVNVSVGDGTLSADAPTPAVVLDYSHDVVESRSVNYQGETWSERYDLNRTWAESNSNATLKVPWASSRVISVRDVTVKRYNSTGVLKSTNTTPTYTHDNGTMIVHLGDVNADWTTRVIANGTKVQVVNGSIKVLEPTNAGDSLDSKIKIKSHSTGFGIEVSGTNGGNLVHYVYNASWTSPNAYAEISNGGADQFLRMPKASAGSTTRIRTAPLNVDPQNDVHVTIVDPNEPRFRISPGASEGDSYDVTWLNAKSGETYELVSVTRDGLVIDKADANSPVLLQDDEDDSETLLIELYESNSTGAGGGGGGGAPLPQDSPSPITSPLLLLPFGALTLLGLALGARRTGAGRWVAFAGAGLVFVVAVVSLLPSTFGSVIAQFGGGLASGLESVSSVLWLGAGAIGLYGLYLAVKRVLGVRPIKIATKGGK